MGLFQRLFGFGPEWARQLPPHIRLSRSQIEQLEAVRQQIGVSEKEKVSEGKGVRHLFPAVTPFSCRLVRRTTALAAARAA